ncbi:hypothetical protein CALVIDRAFT_531127 [Calocera viscosa TUFC12733]|uniref:Uncharacterized protein n=1 Tax=Calocera viscosa (strain TUFC12733) TaxID=1330018 RepID=A0A167GUZ1_CALVF|nr:hypothetical protein CALVIDRAFT_531127 [Calocera viscosa TUFC12733]
MPPRPRASNPTLRAQQAERRARAPAAGGTARAMDPSSEIDIPVPARHEERLFSREELNRAAMERAPPMIQRTHSSNLPPITTLEREHTPEAMAQAHALIVANEDEEVNRALQALIETGEGAASNPVDVPGTGRRRRRPYVPTPAVTSPSLPSTQSDQTTHISETPSPAPKSAATAQERNEAQTPPRSRASPPRSVQSPPRPAHEPAFNPSLHSRLDDLLVLLADAPDKLKRVDTSEVAPKEVEDWLQKAEDITAALMAWTDEELRVHLHSYDLLLIAVERLGDAWGLKTKRRYKLRGPRAAPQRFVDAFELHETQQESLHATRPIEERVTACTTPQMLIDELMRGRIWGLSEVTPTVLRQNFYKRSNWLNELLRMIIDGETPDWAEMRGPVLAEGCFLLWSLALLDAAGVDELDDPFPQRTRLTAHHLDSLRSIHFDEFLNKPTNPFVQRGIERVKTAAQRQQDRMDLEALVKRAIPLIQTKKKGAEEPDEPEPEPEPEVEHAPVITMGEQHDSDVNCLNLDFYSTNHLHYVFLPISRNKPAIWTRNIAKLVKWLTNVDDFCSDGILHRCWARSQPTVEYIRYIVPVVQHSLNWHIAANINHWPISLDKIPIAVINRLRVQVQNTIVYRPLPIPRTRNELVNAGRHYPDKHLLETRIYSHMAIRSNPSHQVTVDRERLQGRRARLSKRLVVDGVDPEDVRCPTVESGELQAFTLRGAADEPDWPILCELGMVLVQGGAIDKAEPGGKIIYAMGDAACDRCRAAGREVCGRAARSRCTYCKRPNINASCMHRTAHWKNVPVLHFDDGSGKANSPIHALVDTLAKRFFYRGPGNTIVHCERQERPSKMAELLHLVGGPQRDFKVFEKIAKDERAERKRQAKAAREAGEAVDDEDDELDASDEEPV